MRLRARRRGHDPQWVGDTGRIRAVLTMGGVPWQDLDDAVQQVRLKLLEHQAVTAEPVRDPHAWTAVVASRVAVDWHRGRHQRERLSQRMLALQAPGVAGATLETFEFPASSAPRSGAGAMSVPSPSM